MKKIALLAALVCLIFTSTLLASERMVLGENFTNTSCGPCYNADPTLNYLAENYPDDISIIRYHVWWPSSGDPFYQYNIPENQARNNYYGNNYVPRFYIDGIIDGEYFYDRWESLFLSRLSEPSPLEIEITGSYTDETREVDLDISVTATDEITLDDLRFQCALTESDIYFNAPNGIDYHHQTMRDMIPDANGESFEIANGETVNFERTFTVDDIIEVENSHVVVFVQSYPSKEVLQAGKVKVTDLSQPLMLEVHIVPDESPVIVPAGGSFGYGAALVNLSDQAAVGDVWVMVHYPEYGMYGPVKLIQEIPLAPNDTLITYTPIQHVPGFAPPGMYNYIAYAGIYPDLEVSTSSFEFEVVAPRGGNANDWNLAGWFNDEQSLPSGIVLGGNYPNPFNAQTSISFSLPSSAHVSLEIYNLMGQKLETLVDGHREAGQHTASWNAANYSSGIYLYKLQVGKQVYTRKMSLLK